MAYDGPPRTDHEQAKEIALLISGSSHPDPCTMSRPTSSRWAFTRIEVLVSISVIGLLVALLGSWAVLSSREAGPQGRVH